MFNQKNIFEGMEIFIVKTLYIRINKPHFYTSMLMSSVSCEEVCDNLGLTKTISNKLEADILIIKTAWRYLLEDSDYEYNNKIAYQDYFEGESQRFQKFIASLEDSLSSIS